MTDIDIIVATYDRPRWLRETLASIRAAAAADMTTTEPNLDYRITVVDDCSPTDAAGEIAMRYGADYIRRDVNGGVAATLATGYAATSGRRVSFWGDDDVMLPGWFSQHLALSDLGFAVVAGSYDLVDAELRLLEHRTLPPGRLSDLMNDVVSVNDGALTAREAIEKVGGLRPERERAMMLTLWLALAHAGYRFNATPGSTWLYRRHGGNLSGQRGAPRDPRFMALRAEAIAEYATVPS